jgi:hypothetical protein
MKCDPMWFEGIDMAAGSTQQSMPFEAPNAVDDVPLDELLKHRGRWVAFSPDGRRIIASSANMRDLDALVRAAGQDPEAVLLDYVPDGDFIQSGAELS